MAKKSKQNPVARADESVAGIKLRHPDRSAPTKETLLQLADTDNLFKQAEKRQRALAREKAKAAKAAKNGLDAGDGASDDSETDADSDAGSDADADISPLAERILDTLLWSVSLAMLHFTLDVLVRNQYAVKIRWHQAVQRTLLSVPVFALLVYSLHRHPSDPRLLRFLPAHLHSPLRQALFFVTSTLTGSYLVHITNRHGYMAVMQQAPPIGCLWVWSVIEMNLAPAVGSLALAVGFMRLMGHSLL